MPFAPRGVVDLDDDRVKRLIVCRVAVVKRRRVHHVAEIAQVREHHNASPRTPPSHLLNTIEHRLLKRHSRVAEVIFSQKARDIETARRPEQLADPFKRSVYLIEVQR